MVFSTSSVMSTARTGRLIIFDSMKSISESVLLPVENTFVVAIFPRKVCPVNHFRLGCLEKVWITSIRLHSAEAILWVDFFHQWIHTIFRRSKVWFVYMAIDFSVFRQGQHCTLLKIDRLPGDSFFKPTRFSNSLETITAKAIAQPDGRIFPSENPCQFLTSSNNTSQWPIYRNEPQQLQMQHKKPRDFVVWLYELFLLSLSIQTKSVFSLFARVHWIPTEKNAKIEIHHVISGCIVFSELLLSAEHTIHRNTTHFSLNLFDCFRVHLFLGWVWVTSFDLDEFRFLCVLLCICEAVGNWQILYVADGWVCVTRVNKKNAHIFIIIKCCFFARIKWKKEYAIYEHNPHLKPKLKTNNRVSELVNTDYRHCNCHNMKI